MESLFITGTDTNVGKTHIAAGLAVTLRKSGIDVGVTKPYAAGTPQRRGFRSKDAEILSDAAQVDDPEDLINPQFFPITASPYTAWKTLGIKPNLAAVWSSFSKLSRRHTMMLVEGMGGVMTPILRNYCVADMIKHLKIPAIIVSRTRIGTINHTIMTVRMCQKYDIPIKGIILNDIDSDGYDTKVLTRDLKSILGTRILGSIPFMKNTDDLSLYRVFQKNIDMKILLQ